MLTGAASSNVVRPRWRVAAAVFTLASAFAHPVGAQARQSPAEPQTPAAAPRLTVSAELRERMESVHAAGFTSGRDDVFWLSRLRLGVVARPVSWMAVTTQVQDARVAGKQIGPTGSPFSAPIDVRLAHVSLGRTSSPVTLALGRQELAFGEQRLVGHVNWANAARTFDAARVTIRRSGLQVDGFVSSVVRIRTDDWDRGGFGSRFHGLYASSTRVIPRATVEPYFLWRADNDHRTEAGALARQRLGTMGVRLAGQLPLGFDYGVETVTQHGSTGPDSHRALAQHLRIRTPVADPGIRFVAEYNYASGDKEAGDGRQGTFDPLYPTPHDKYGLADQIGWRNIHHARMAVNVTTVLTLPVTAAYHSWWLASRADALYGVSGAAVVRIPQGAPSAHVGQGFDVQASHAFSSRLEVAGGYAWLHPGDFLRAATAGDSHHAVFVMLSATLSTRR